MTAETQITMGVFYQSLPMMVAAQKGFNAQHGLAVDYQKVSSSIQQAEYLRDGQYDTVQTSPDNVANYRLNENNPVGEIIPARAFMGMDYGMYLVVAARPGTGSIGELRGKKLAVDAPASGFAYVLYKILRAHGLERDEDYEVVAVGGVADRYTALLNDEFDATLLSGGFETRAANAGYQLLDSVYDIASPYLGVVGAAKDSWQEANRDVVVRLIRAYRDATAWCVDPGNRDEAVDLLAALPNTDRPLAEQLYDVQLRPGVGIVPDAGIDPAALATVMAMRAEFDGFEKPQDVDQLATEEGGIFTLQYYEEALAG
jgi:ABC-type nitrate/sulfonate/bicarbonate transport system substrate-binding protein